jgi:beta-ketoacyl-acyl-carrier-protein synthase II
MNLPPNSIQLPAMPRVVITGVGVISPIGHTATESWDNLIKGVSGIGPITQFDASQIPVHIAGEVKDFDPGKYMNPKEARRMSRASQLAIAAARMALADARLPEPLPDGERVATWIGNGGGGLEVVDRELNVLRTKGYNQVSPFALTSFLPNMAAHHVSLVAGAKGPISTVVTACASGTQAVGEGMDLIRHGRADIVFAGGVEGLIHETSVASFARTGALSTRNDDPGHACRPFDATRDGTVVSEGAAILVLEKLEDALARNARIYAEVIGHASSADAFHLARPDPEAQGAVRAIRWALEDARVTPREVDYINAHGTATLLNDPSETLAVKKVFGDYAYQLPISSSKAVLGHSMGAAGAIEAVICMYALYHGLIPPTWNYEQRDPACDLDYVPNQPRQADLKVVLSNSFGMGGQNACLVLRKYA